MKTTHKALAWASVALCSQGCELIDRVRGGGRDLRSGDTAELTDVIKGDEVQVSHHGNRYRVRMLGIAAFEPVLRDPFLEEHGKAAAEWLNARRGHPVEVFFDGEPRDPSGRYLAYLQADHDDLGRAMVRAGVVPVYTEFAFGREAAYLAAEQAARQAQEGFWAQAAAVPLVVGLRKQWRQVRQARGDRLEDDPLLPR